MRQINDRQAFAVNEAQRRSIEDYVKPLAVGLDGVTNYGDVARAVSAAEMITAGLEGDVLDKDLVFLLAVFSGQEKWVSRMGHRSRSEIFLESQGVPRQRIAALFRGLSRFEKSPEKLEERIVHDAVLLDSMGAYGVARALADAYRERLDIGEMAAAIEEAAAATLLTEPARALAEPRRRSMLDFAARLREELAEFSG
jgi:hypothetical protein